MARIPAVVVFSYGCTGDEARCFATVEAAKRAIIEYAEEYWSEDYGPMPTTYQALCAAWDDYSLHGSFDCRWELQFDVEVES